MKRFLITALLVFTGTEASALSITPQVSIDHGGNRNLIFGCGDQGHVGVVRVRASGGFFHTQGTMRRVQIRAQHPSLWEFSTGGSWADWQQPHVFSIGQPKPRILISVRRKPGSHHDGDGGVWTQFHLERADDHDFRLGGSPPAFYVMNGGRGCDVEADDPLSNPISEEASDDLLSNPVDEGNTRSLR